MIERTEIRNWQSLRKVDLDFGRFTVIVGPSSSGKTGLMRAMRGIASNVRGTGAITRGQKTCAITVRTGDTVISLERAEGSGTYKVLKDGQVTAYTKLAGAVPAQVTEALKIAPVPTGGSSINFAGQFDKPYLLDESGSTVARELAELTNVNVVFEAVRNANKRRNALAADLKAHEKDLGHYTAKAAEYAATLPGKLALIAQAEQLAQRATASADRVTALQHSIDRLQIAEQVLAKAVVPEGPDLTEFTTAVDRRILFRRHLFEWLTSEQAHTSAETDVQSYTADEQRFQTELVDLLRAAGRCPTCGQNVH